MSQASGYNLPPFLTFLTIIFMIPENESFGYALQRVVDTFIGTGIALGVNHFIRPKKARASSIE